MAYPFYAPSCSGALHVLYLLNSHAIEKKRIQMILTCPSCISRFMVPDDALGKYGRRVKCSVCNEIWHQDPPETLDQDPLSDLEDMLAAHDSKEIEDDELERNAFFEKLLNDQNEDEPSSSIPESVKPVETDNVTLKEESFISKKAQIAGYAGAGGVFVSILIMLLVLQGPIIKSWPPARAIYELFGSKLPAPGEGLVFDNIKINKKDEGIAVQGSVINLTKQQRDVPLIEVAIMSEYNELVDRWYMQAPKDILNPEETIAFSSFFKKNPNAPKVRGKPTQVQMRFVLIIKTDAKVSDNILSPQQGGQAHPSANEAL